jgi:hypothetical protein
MRRVTCLPNQALFPVGSIGAGASIYQSQHPIAAAIRSSRSIAAGVRPISSASLGGERPATPIGHKRSRVTGEAFARRRLRATSYASTNRADLLDRNNHSASRVTDPSVMSMASTRGLNHP